MRLPPMSQWLLPVSLSLNVFLAAAMLVHARPPKPPGPPPGRMVEEMAQTLPAADAVILRQAFADRVKVFETKERESMEAVRQGLSQALAAETFDPEAVRAAFAAGRRAKQEKDQAVEDSLVEAASRMSPEGRKKLSEWTPPRPFRK